MKKLLIVGLLFSVQNVLPVVVQMPDEKTLNARLQGIGMSFFNARSKISQNLADQKLESSEILNRLEKAYDDFFTQIDPVVKALNVERKMTTLKAIILKALLQDNQDALKEVPSFY